MKIVAIIFFVIGIVLGLRSGMAPAGHVTGAQ